MSILARYRKPGGFLQLLKLIETSQPAKQEKLLDVVEKEDPRWAELIREKKLTSEMILSWDHSTQATIFEYMVARHCATLFKRMEEGKLVEFRDIFKLEKYKELHDLVEHMNDPLESEYIAACNHLLETVRYLDEEKKIILRFINPILDLEEAA